MITKMRLFTLLALCLISSSLFALPTENPSVITHAELLRVIGGLLLVLLIIMVLSWIVKRVHGVNLSSAKGFHSVASMTLGPKERVVLLQVGSQYLLLGVGAGTVSLLRDFGEQLPAGFDGEHKTSFAELLKSAVGKS